MTDGKAKRKGMFETDKEIGLRVDTEFELREEFILYDAEIAGDLVDTKIGKARKTILTVARLDEPDVRFETTTLASAIADKAQDATPDDFPVVVELRKVASSFGNDALVLQYKRDYK